MATLKRCPQGHFYDGDRYTECPYCEADSRQEEGGGQTDAVPEEKVDVTQPVDQESGTASPPAPPRRRSAATAVLAVVALAAVGAAVFFGYQWQSAEKARERAQASYESKQEELEELEEELESERKEEVGALQGELESAQEELENAQAQLESAGELAAEQYGYGSDTYYSPTPILVLEAGGSDGKIPIYFGKNGTVRFSESSSDIDGRWSSEWESNWTDVLVTPGTTAGSYTIHFSNDEDSAEFDVLVVVR